jgi:hypothetical protein
MAAAEAKKGAPGDWNTAILEREVSGPAAVIASGSRDA